MKIHGYEVHPLAEAFPLLDDESMRRLGEDIRDNGLQCPITLFEGKIIDGRNRALACKKYRIDPDFEEVEDVDPAAFVVSMNLRRRHLDESQRAMIAARMSALLASRNLPADSAPPVEHASDMLNVSDFSTKAARAVIAKGNPVLTKAVDDGVLPVSQAAKLAKLDAKTQNTVVHKVRSGLSPAEAQRELKAEQIKANGTPQQAKGKHRVLYADPPWSYGNSMPPGTGVPTDHYPCMSLDEICELPVKDMAEDDSVLFLWTTSPHLEESFRVIEAWGFKYKTSFVWDKVKHNMGHYNSVRHEFVLVCVRGSCQPDVRKLFDSVVTEERTEHSKKPEVFYEIIDTIYPHGARIELFARSKRKGWKSWGLESK